MKRCFRAFFALFFAAQPSFALQAERPANLALSRPAVVESLAVSPFSLEPEAAPGIPAIAPAAVVNEPSAAGVVPTAQPAQPPASAVEPALQAPPQAASEDAGQGPERARDSAAAAFDGSSSDRQPFFVRHYGLARLILTPFVKVFYRTRVSGLENLPKGPAIIVPNHVSYVDPLLLAYAAKRPMRFIMARRMYDLWYLKPFVWLGGAIPIEAKDLQDGSAGLSSDAARQESIQKSIDQARQLVKSGQTVVIFPEGHLTRNGNMLGFRKGFERIAAGLGVPVIAAHLDNFWGSVFSLRASQSLWQRLKQAPRRVGISFGAALADPGAQRARLAVQELSAQALERRVRADLTTLPRAFLRAAKKWRVWFKPAVADSGMELSYGQTLTGAVILSRRLERKLTAAKRVGVLLPPSVGGALTNIALARLGRVAVNLNYSTGLDVLRQSMAVAQLDQVVTSRRFVEAMKAKGVDLTGLPLVILEDLPQASKREKLAWYGLLLALPRRAVEAIFLRRAARSIDEEATIVFTSGSTAVPKGTQLTHLNLQSDIEMVKAAGDFGAQDSMLGVLPFFHSFGYTVSLWLPLTMGMPVAYHSHPLELKPIAQLAEKYKPTILMGTPLFLLRYAEKIPREAFASLRRVIAGADRLGDAGDIFEKKFGIRPLEGYGATELSPVAAVNVPDEGGQVGTMAGSVGQNLPGTAARVVDPETGANLPYGQRGLLLIKGPHVMRGYLGEPKKTAEVVKDGWYDTGDLAEMDWNGFIYIKGRAAVDFGKIAGEKVPYEDVAERLQRASGLSERAFVVTGVPDAQRGTRLVVLFKGYAGAVAELLAKAKEAGMPALWMPAPASFHRVDDFPMLGSGKLDKKGVIELAKKLEAGR